MVSVPPRQICPESVLPQRPVLCGHSIHPAHCPEPLVLMGLPAWFYNQMTRE